MRVLEAPCFCREDKAYLVALAVSFSRVRCRPGFPGSRWGAGGRSNGLGLPERRRGAPGCSERGAQELRLCSVLGGRGGRGVHHRAVRLCGGLCGCARDPLLQLPPCAPQVGPLLWVFSLLIVEYNCFLLQYCRGPSKSTVSDCHRKLKLWMACSLAVAAGKGAVFAYLEFTGRGAGLKGCRLVFWEILA